jgi:hypothetical protein
MRGRWITSGFCAMVRLMPCERCGTAPLRPSIAALGVCLVAGCLPAGEPPAGQHIVADRSIAAVFFAASEAENVPSRLVVLGPIRPIPPWGFAGVDLYAATYAQPNASLPGPVAGLAALTPVVTGVALSPPAMSFTPTAGAG